MAVRIRRTPYTRSGGANLGPYTVFPDEVFAQLGVIAMAGSDQLPGSLGDSPDPADSAYSIVTFDPGPQDAATAQGRVRQLFKDLVDGGENVILFGMGEDFVWEDGSTLEDSAGGAIGEWIFYDVKNCGGNGRWIRGTNGEEECTLSAGILFHEMVHVKLNHPVGTVEEDEMAAVEGENDFRTAVGQVPRDPEHWFESDCDCPGGCCIVASVASGSPWSAQVHALRRLRDGLLRGTRIGHQLFDAIHEEYYRFSVSVARTAAADERAREMVDRWLVRPLVRTLELAAAHFTEPETSSLAEALAEDANSGFLAELGGPANWRRLRSLLEDAARGEVPFALPILGGPAAAKIFRALAANLPDCPHVRWAIVQPLALYAEARARYAESGSSRSAGAWLEAQFEAWLAEIPFEQVFAGLTTREIATDLDVLATRIFARQAVRHRIGARLLAEGRVVPSSPFAERLTRAGYFA